MTWESKELHSSPCTGYLMQQYLAAELNAALPTECPRLCPVMHCHAYFPSSLISV